MLNNEVKQMSENPLSPIIANWYSLAKFRKGQGRNEIKYWQPSMWEE